MRGQVSPRKRAFPSSIFHHLSSLAAAQPPLDGARSGGGRSEQGREGKAELRRPKSGVKKTPPQTRGHAQDTGNERLTPQIPRSGGFPPSAVIHLIPEALGITPASQPQPATGPAGNDRFPPPPAQEPPRYPRHAQTVTDRPANSVARIFKGMANDSPSPQGEGRGEGGRGSKLLDGR